MKKLDLLDTSGAAAFLNVTTRAVAFWRFQKIGPPYLKLGRRVFYDPRTLERWARAQERRPAAA